MTNYVFHYFESCLCRIVSATVTVMSNTVVKIEDARDREGNLVANPSLSFARTISGLLDAWIEWEPTGGYARRLEFDPNGFPRIIDIDLARNIADEELIFAIDSFTPLPSQVGLDDAVLELDRSLHSGIGRDQSSSELSDQMRSFNPDRQ